LNVRNSPLSNILDQISDQTGYNFFYSNSTLNDSKPITIIVKNAELHEVLQQIFADQALVFTIEEKNVVIREKMTPAKETIQAKTERAATILTGKVTDERGNSSGTLLKIAAVPSRSHRSNFYAYSYIKFWIAL